VAFGSSRCDFVGVVAQTTKKLYYRQGDLEIVKAKQTADAHTNLCRPSRSLLSLFVCVARVRAVNFAPAGHLQGGNPGLQKHQKNINQVG
jgi:hypothetical protein